MIIISILFTNVPQYEDYWKFFLLNSSNSLNVIEDLKKTKKKYQPLMLAMLSSHSVNSYNEEKKSEIAEEERGGKTRENMEWNISN